MAQAKQLAPVQVTWSLGARLPVGLLAGALVAWAIHASYYAPFLSDDALISLRYADRFVDGLGLTWTDGEKVEGYSDLLFILLCAALHAIGFDLIWAARLLAGLGVVAALIVVSLDPKTNRPNLERSVAGSLGLALCAPAAVWTVGALEHGLIVGVIVTTLFLITKSMSEDRLGRISWACTGLLSSLVLLRVDGALLVFGMVFPTLFFKGKGSLKKFFLWSTVPALVLLLHHLFRYAYYGEWVANTALAKVAINEERLLLGLNHVAQGFRALWPVLIAAGLAFAGSVRVMRAAAWAPALGLLVTWTVYLIIVGGDIFPGWRQLLLALAALYYLFAQSLAAQLDSPEPMDRISALAGSAFLIALGLYTQSKDSENARAKTERWEFAGLSVGPVLRQAFATSQPLLAVDAAGALPYWSELPSLDMLGLNDSYIAHHPPPNFGHGGIGHELGDGAYVLSRKPDLIAFNNASGFRKPMFLSGRQMVTTKEFQNNYTLMRIEGRPPLRAIGEIFVRNDGKVGFTEKGETTVIPGYLMSQGSAPAKLAPSGRLVTSIQSGKVAAINGIRLKRGTYRVRILSEGAPLLSTVRCRGMSMTPARSPARNELIFSTSVNAPMSILAETTGPESVVTGIEVQEVEEPAAQACSSGTIRTTLAQLGNAKKENTAWDAPGNVVFSQRGLDIEIDGGLRRASHMTLSTDNNDTYKVLFLNAEKTVGEVTISPRVNKGGMANHDVQVPAKASTEGFDRIRLDVAQGDGSYSLGHLILH